MKTRGLPGDLRSQLDSIVESTKNPVDEALSSEPQAPKKVSRKSWVQSFKDLDQYLREAKAGMPDDQLGRLAGATKTCVAAWRKARKIQRKTGYRSRLDSEMWAVDAFGDGFTPGLQPVRPTTKAQWDLPEYVLRKPLNYDTLCRIVHCVSTHFGMEEEEIASGIGLRIRDIEMALAVETSHLDTNGVPCIVCGTPCDLRYGKVCSKRCREDSKPT